MKTIKSIKKASLLCVFVFGFAAISNAQFGIRVGGVLSNHISANDLTKDNYKSNVGLDLAAFYNINMGTFGIQPELHFIQKGSTFEDITGLNDDSKSTLNYIEVPVLFKLNFGETSTNFHVLAGPSVGYLTSGTIKYGDIKEDIESNDYNNLEFGGQLGAGIKFGSIGIDVRYLIGFTDVPKLNGSNTFKNTGLSAGVSLYF